MSKPIPATKPTLRLSFSFDTTRDPDYTGFVHEVNFKGIVNGGYLFSARLYDPALSLFDDLVEQRYFVESLKGPQWLKFQLAGSIEGEFPSSATRPQYGMIVAMRSILESSGSFLEIIAIDPITYGLTMGDASGGAYKGTIDGVIRQLLDDYGITINGQRPSVDVTRFAGSDEVTWNMYRQDPKSFLVSLLEWSSGLTESKTQLLMGVDGNNLVIKEQAKIQERRRGYYMKYSAEDDNIIEHKILANNLISAVDTKMITSGASSTAGSYLDHKQDFGENYLVVSDKTTTNKYVPRISRERGFTKANAQPGNGKPFTGSSIVGTIPELLSNGEIGVPYQYYIDGRARNTFYNVSNGGLKMLLTVFGHGEYSDTIGLGADTVFVQLNNMANNSTRGYFWSTGFWIVRGFHHRLTKSYWVTDLLLTRLEHDAEGRKVGV